MFKESKKLLLAFMLTCVFAAPGGAGAASIGDCPGGVTLKAGGVMECAGGGAATLPACAGGNFVLDSTGAISCSAPLQTPVCTLAQSLFAGQTTIEASCSPAATSYEWSANTGFADTASGGPVSPSVTTTYTVSGINDAGKGVPVSLTVTVGGTSGAPVCTLSASPASISAGSSATLTASCSPAATSYTWSAAGCSGSSATCTVAPASTTTYTVRGTNSAGTGASASAKVTVAAASGPPVCTLTEGQFSGQKTLTAACSPAATSYIWSSNAGLSNSQSGGVISPQPTVTTTYTVKGVNAAGQGKTASLTITVSNPTPSCTLAANPATIDQGGSSTLTASCNPVADSHTWTGTGCAAETGKTCTVAQIDNTTAYTVTGTNSAGTGNTASTTVTVAKPSCTVTANPASVAPGASSTLTANCSPSVGTTYLWTGGACEGVTTSTCNTGALATSTSYTVTGSNSLGDSDPASIEVTVAKPVCTLTASPAKVGRGETSALTASCSPAATEGYTWTGEGCTAETGNTCDVTPMVAGTTTYTVVGANLAGDSTAASATVTAAAPSCTLTASPNTVSPGASSTLTASCSPTPSSYAWSDAACAGKTTTCTVSPSDTKTYTVTGSDQVGDGNTASATVTVASDPGCPNGYTYSTKNITWPASTRLSDMPVQTMNHCEVMAFRFTMPARTYAVSETFYANTPKYLSLSKSAYDFSPGSGCANEGYNNPKIRHSTTGDSRASCQVTEGATYYLNVRNAQSADGPDVCKPGAKCTFQLSW